jgi:hypothetical protein
MTDAPLQDGDSGFLAGRTVSANGSILGWRIDGFIIRVDGWGE